jgi:hypothetical protein
MNEEFKKLNSKYNDDTYPEYPFISPNRITLLNKGLYRKHGAKYRGVTAVFNAETGEFTYPLYGMYWVPEDIIIVPESLQLNENKTSFLSAALKAGYRKTDTPPTFQPVFFNEDSPEAKLALANKATFYRSKRKDITI